MRRLLAAVLLASGAALAQTPVTLIPTADAYVLDGAWADSNFGSGGGLYAKSANNQTYDSYLKFDMSGATSVANAKLRLNASASGGGGDLTIYAVADTGWTELGITWNNKPARAAGLVTGAVTSTSFLYYEFDVTGYLQAEKAAGRNVVGFALHMAQVGNGMVWARDKEYGANAPQLVITPSVPPTVSIGAPSAGQVFQAPATITVSANAADPDGTVSQVEFFANGTSIGTDSTAPFGIEWTNVAAGNYSLTARARDNLGEQTLSAAVAISVNGQPTVSITSPASGTVLQAPGSVTLTATAADGDGAITKVDFYQGTTLVGTGTAAPYSATVSNLAAGSYSFTAVATDDRGGSATSSAIGVRVNAAPTVSITSPAGGAVFNAPASITVTASAGDADGTIAKVDFYQGATLIGTATAAPFSATAANLGSGSYSFTAVALDNDGQQTTSAAVSVTVNAAPSVSLTSPANNATFNAPASIALTAQVADTDGSIAAVEFYHGATLITTLTAPPYSFTWTGVPQGAYSLTARATDNNGATATSAAVNVTVNQAVGQLYFIHVDHVGTPREIYNQAQQLVWRSPQAEPFGDSPPDENPSGLGVFQFDLGFPGQVRNRETGTLYNYFRDCYDPATGRYCQFDPIGLRGGINGYAYVHGNPLSFTDPEGLKALICCRTLNSFFLGTVLRQRHCYFNVDGMTYGLYPEGNIGVPREGDGRDRGGICQECKPRPPCTDVNSCIKQQHGSYPVGSYDAVYGPNSNSYAGTIAKACCAGGIPPGTGDAPGIIDPPPAPIP